jgi:translation initiation factor IF-2
MWISFLKKSWLKLKYLTLKANPDRNAQGALLLKQSLIKARVLPLQFWFKKVLCRLGDSFVAGNYNGRVKAMYDERGHKVNSEAKPATPVQVLGFDGMPQAGDVLVSMDSEREARGNCIQETAA